jgi:hypothetical protein
MEDRKRMHTYRKEEEKKKERKKKLHGPDSFLRS